MKNIARWFVVLAFTFVSVIAPSPARAAAGAEDWKVKTPGSDLVVSAIPGLGIVDARAGFSFVGAVSKKILEGGFAPEISNSVSIELELGPLFARSSSALFYSAHLRWDFRKDDAFSLYALGGFGGFGASLGVGNTNEFFPRFGIGSFYKLHDLLSLRAELSHELVGVGIAYHVF